MMKKLVWSDLEKLTPNQRKVIEIIYADESEPDEER
jgi:hypothetical protein